MATKKPAVKQAAIKKPKAVKINKAPHIFVATPMYGGMCAGPYTQSLMAMPAVLNQHGVSMSCGFLFNESLITRARNALVKNFLATDATHLMFIDADIRFNPYDILHMINSNKDIICGIYPKKEINWHTVRHAIANGVPNEKLTNHTGSFVVNLVGYSGQTTVRADQPCEIWNGGTGFMLIKRSVFKKLEKKVKTYINDVVDLTGNLDQRVPIKEYFFTEIEPGTERLLSEDYAFCRLARENGIKIHAAPWAKLGHLGSYMFDGQLIETP